MTQPISSPVAPGFMTELAVLLMQNDDNQAESNRLERDAARQSYLADAQSQVNALNAAADATEAGALTSFGCSMVSAGCTTASAFSKFDAETGSCKFDEASNTRDAKVLDAYAGAYGALGQLNKALSESTAEHFQADAKRSESRMAQDKWVSEDASSEIDKANKRTDQALQTLQSTEEAQNQASNAIIGRI